MVINDLIYGNNPSPSIDFRSHDDAWYTVQLSIQNNKLIMKYDDFSDDYNDEFNAGDFKSLKEVEDFKEKFRPTSVQLQDRECSKVIQGMTVCASCDFSDSARKFYDAVIEAVNDKEHTFAEGEEVCTCTFVVFWAHGPMVGSRMLVKVANICLLQYGNVQSDPALASFLKMSRMKFEVASHSSSVISEDDCMVCGASKCHCGIYSSKANFELKSTHSKPHTCCVEETKSSERFIGTPQTFRGGSRNHVEEIEQDIDLGVGPIPTDNLREASNCHFILIENMDKDLSPLIIVSFVYRHTSITSQVFVFPSLPSESYTRGIIVVDSHEKLQQLSDFFTNPAHLVMSSKGRPLVITEKELKHGTFGISQSISEVDFGVHFSCKPWHKSEKLGVKLKVARRGTKEFKKGKQLIKLYMELSEHIQGLHKRLALEEEKILLSPNTA